MPETEPDRLDRSGSRFARVIVAAKRARQIKDGARTLVESRSANVLTVALDEMLAGEILPLHVEEPEPLPTSAPPSPVIGGLLSTSVAGDLLDLTADLEEDLVVTPVADELSEADADALDVDEDEDEDEEALGEDEAAPGDPDAATDDV